MTGLTSVKGTVFKRLSNSMELMTESTAQDKALFFRKTQNEKGRTTLKQ